MRQPGVQWGKLCKQLCVSGQARHGERDLHLRVGGIPPGNRRRKHLVGKAVGERVRAGEEGGGSGYLSCTT